MTDEEKEAIEYFKDMLSFYYHNTQICTHDKMNILINFIEKQQKEIENKNLIIRFDKELLDNYEKKIAKKDKQIDLMIEHIVSSAVVDDTICYLKCDCEEDKDCDFDKQRECTKQYFEKEAENED